jgi:hypothetical protein
VFTRDPNRAGTLKHRTSNKPLPQVSQFAEQGVLSCANEQRFDNILMSSLPFEYQTEAWVGQQISIDIHHIAKDCLSTTLPKRNYRISVCMYLAARFISHCNYVGNHLLLIPQMTLQQLVTGNIA